MLGGLLKALFGGGAAPDNAAGNAGVRAQLAAMGDDGTIPRHVLHYVYPNKKHDSAPREDIAAFLAGFDFDVVRDAEQDGGFVMEQNREVASAEFDAFTGHLTDTLRDMGWDYDGWECAVATEE